MYFVLILGNIQIFTLYIFQIRYIMVDGPQKFDYNCGPYHNVGYYGIMACVTYEKLRHKNIWIQLIVRLEERT